MRRKWLTLALLAIGLGCGATANAQTLPTPIGAARMPDPSPCPTPTPNLIPGPLTSYQAPAGPPDELSLPANAPSAFQCEDFASHCEFFFHIGSTGLNRQHLGRGPLVFEDANQTRLVDNGSISRPLATLTVVNINDVDPDLHWGISGTAGILFNSCSLEFTGLYIPEQRSSVRFGDAGRLNLFFVNTPLGFEGNNGIFRQADQVQLTFENSVVNGEVNVRMFNPGITGCELLLGTRYVEYRERYGILVDDDGLQFRDAFNRPDPNRIGEYSASVTNRIVGPQIGVEYQTNIVHGWSVGAYLKAGVGINFSETQIHLRRGDGFEGLNANGSKTSLSHMYEFGIYTDIYLLERLRVRGGYQILALCHVLEATDQINYNLANPLGHNDDTGNIYLHGPVIQAQFLF